MVQWNWLHPEAFIKVTNTKWQGLFWFIIGENCTYLKCCIYIRFRDYPSWYDIWAFFFYEIFFLHILHSPLYHNFCLKRNLFETRKQSNFNWKQENCFLPVFLEFSNIFFFNLHWIAWLRLLTIIINILHVLVWNHIYSNLKYNNRGGKLLKKILSAYIVLWYASLWETIWKDFDDRLVLTIHWLFEMYQVS